MLGADVHLYFEALLTRITEKTVNPSRNNFHCAFLVIFLRQKLPKEKKHIRPEKSVKSCCFFLLIFKSFARTLKKNEETRVWDPI